MAQFRTTADLMDLALTNAGEVTNGNSPYEADLLNKLNRVHFSLIAGGTIALGPDSTVEIDEVWPWAISRRPMIIELQPKITTGTISTTLGSEAITFSSGPSVSVAGWYLKIDGQEGVYRVASHTAAATSAELDGAWPLASVSGGSFTLYKIDYDLVPTHIVIDETNNKIDFKTTSGGGVLTATLTAGSYTPSDLISHVATQMTTSAAGPTITGSYSSLTKLFTLTSDGAGSTVLLPLFATGTNQKLSGHKALGFDDEDLSSALTHTSTYALGGVARLIEPFRIQRGTKMEILGLDKESFGRSYSPNNIEEGVPTKFAVIYEGNSGDLKVRFNKYPEEKTRVEIDYVAVPRDLKDNAGSIPIVPRKFMDVIEDAATFYIMLLKHDSRAGEYAGLVKGKLQAMVNQHRGQLVRTGDSFGRIYPRRERMTADRMIFPSEPYDV